MKCIVVFVALSALSVCALAGPSVAGPTACWMPSLTISQCPPKPVGAIESFASPANANPQQLYNFYANIISKSGGTLHPLGPNGLPLITVLGLRGIDLQNKIHPTVARRSFDDTIVVMTANGVAVKIPYASYSFQLKSSQSADVNGDGTGDVGIIRPGEYFVTYRGMYTSHSDHRTDQSWQVWPRVTTRLPDGGVAFNRSSQDVVPMFRDTNHDGTIDNGEISASINRGKTQAADWRKQVDSKVGDYGAGVFFHLAGSSLGCQVMSDNAYAVFKNLLNKSAFNYVLVQANAHLPNPVVQAGNSRQCAAVNGMCLPQGNCTTPGATTVPGLCPGTTFCCAAARSNVQPTIAASVQPSQRPPSADRCAAARGACLPQGSCTMPGGRIITGLCPGTTFCCTSAPNVQSSAPASVVPTRANPRGSQCANAGGACFASNLQAACVGNRGTVLQGLCPGPFFCCKRPTAATGRRPPAGNIPNTAACAAVSGLCLTQNACVATGKTVVQGALLCPGVTKCCK